MKAILVVDIDDSLIEGEDKFAVDGYLMQEADCAGCYEAVGIIKNEPLKPLPEHKKPQDPDETWEEMHVRMGYNKCLEEIENVDS